MVRAGLIAVALLLCAPSFADNTADALQLMDQGMALFKNGDYRGARESFVRAQKLVPDKANPYRWLGLADARLGNCADAITELDAFVAKVPSGDPRTVEAITLRDRCKEELQPKVGTLAIESTPPGAEVRIDDERSAPVGVTPWRSEKLTAGPHLVFLGKTGFRPLSKGVTVDRGVEVRLDLTLQPEPPPVVTTAPVVATPALVAAAPAAPVKKRSRAWIAGPVVGGVVLLVGAVVLGVVLAGGGGPTMFPTVRAP